MDVIRAYNLADNILPMSYNLKILGVTNFFIQAD